MEVRLWAFYKRTNSLDVPAASSTPTVYTDVTLKEGTSVLEPIIRIKWDGVSDLSSKTYAEIPQWGRKYFVVDAVFEDRCWNLKLRIDVLGTYEFHIRRATLPIIRASRTFDGSRQDVIIPDAKFPPGLVHDDKVWVTGIPGWTSTPASGYYVIGFIGSGNDAFPAASKIGGNVYCVCDSAELHALIGRAYSKMYNQNSSLVDNIVIAIENLAKSIFNPGQFISNVIWLPYQPYSAFAPVNDFWLGNFHFTALEDPDIEVHPISSTTQTTRIHLALADLMPASGERNFSIEPYATYYLEFWPFGIYPIDGRTLVAPDTTGIDIDVTVDNITGAARFIAKRSTASGSEGAMNLALLASGSGQIGVSVPIGGISTHEVQTVQSIAGTITSVAAVAAGNFAAAGGIAAGALSAVAASAPTAVTSGACGGFAGADSYISLHRTKFNPAMVDYPDAGRAFARITQIDNVRGFIQCWDGHVDLPPWSMAQERDEVDRYLREGFFNGDGNEP